ncbi:MAG: hypothetical protein IT548_12025 [Alphaproteobacteria bacterium]|nr:hypothetical protein [Alphaproteobacteria bacterium]
MTTTPLDARRPARPAFARVLARLRALAGLGLAPELLVPEMSIVLGRALSTVTYPAVFAISSEAAAARPQDFTVWLGAEQTVQEIRQSLALGIWPGPSGTPSLQTIMTRRDNRRVFAATLWGEGCTDEGPWGDLWRARNLQQGLQTVWFAPSGLTVVAVMARETGAPPFSAADIAFAEAAAPIITAVVDRAAGDDPYEAAVPEVQLVLDAEGKPASMSFGVAEMLRDIGGGGAGAAEATLQRIGKAASAIDAAPAQGLPGDPFIRIRQALIRPSPNGASSLNRDIPFGENAFGAYAVRFAPMSGPGTPNGHLMVTIRRKIPAVLLTVRGALASGLSAREIELAATLVRGQTLEGAAADMKISLSSVRTMMDRLLVRLEAPGRAAALAQLAERGRQWSW